MAEEFELTNERDRQEHERVRTFYQDAIMELINIIPPSSSHLLLCYDADPMLQSYQWWIEGKCENKNLYVGFNDERWTETVVRVEGEEDIVRQLPDGQFQ